MEMGNKTWDLLSEEERAEADAIVEASARRERSGQFELLVEDIETAIRDAEGGWWINREELVVHEAISRDPSRRNNGGEYDYYRCYRPGLGVVAYDDWSCDFASCDQYGGEKIEYDCILSLSGLRRIAQLADVTIAARAWLAKEPGCMSKLKAAIRSLNDY
jgi:hypothetical protein